MKNLTAIIIGLVIGLFGGIAGFQISIAGEVSAHKVAINKLEKDFDKEQNRTDQRIFNLANLIENSNNLLRSSIEQTGKLIATVEAQNKVITAQSLIIDQLRNKRPNTYGN